MVATQFEIDSAMMAGRAYFDTRASINRFSVPQGWVEFNHRALDWATGDRPRFLATRCRI